jgi:hypothetical protein
MACSGNNAERHVDAAGRLRAAPCHRVIFATSSAADLAGNTCLLQRPGVRSRSGTHGYAADRKLIRSGESGGGVVSLVAGEAFRSWG